MEDTLRAFDRKRYWLFFKNCLLGAINTEMMSKAPIEYNP
jgi:hypothetical protein